MRCVLIQRHDRNIGTRYPIAAPDRPQTTKRSFLSTILKPVLQSVLKRKTFGYCPTKSLTKSTFLIAIKPPQIQLTIPNQLNRGNKTKPEMSSYRPSLGTRGELRRIAAEAETATIERVRPWKRKLQPCKLAPHVLVPQWVRGEAAQQQPPANCYSDEVVRAILKALMDEACKGPPPRRVTTRASDAASLNGAEGDDEGGEIVNGGGSGNGGAAVQEGGLAGAAGA